MNNALKVLSAGLLVASAGMVCAQNAESIDDVQQIPSPDPIEGAPVWSGPSGNVLFDNGPLVTSVGTGAGGADESILENVTLGNTTLGFAHQIVSNQFQVADDFTIVGQPWTINEIVFFAYQTGSPTTSTINDYRVQIWDGPPAAMGSNVVWGDLVTNVLGTSEFSNIYRVAESTPGDTNRPIMANTVPVGVTLPPGQYWIEWEAGGTLGSGPWAPPVTIQGQAATGDGLQSADDGLTFAPVVDGGSTEPQGLPFIITGLSGTQAVPTMNAWGLGLLMLLMAGVAFVVIRRS